METHSTVSYCQVKIKSLQPTGHSPIVKIDGWTNPCDGTRFCLGIITNISRNREIELVRRNIGNGISLIYEQGTISLKNTSDSSIFVQSEQLNIQWKLKPKACWFNIWTELNCICRLFSLLNHIQSVLSKFQLVMRPIYSIMPDLSSSYRSVPASRHCIGKIYYVP